MGDWKLVAAKGQPWELYDLGRDRTETHDLASEQPAKARELTDRWQALHENFESLAREAR